MKQIGLALLQYIGDWDERLPNRGVGNIDLDDRLQAYAKSRQIFVCPSQTKVVDAAGVESKFIPVAPNPANNQVSYGYNSEQADVKYPALISAVQYTDRLCLVAENSGSVDRVSLVGSTTDDRFLLASRHLEGANLLFADGHVKWINQGHRGVTYNLLSSTSKNSGTFWLPTATSP